MRKLKKTSGGRRVWRKNDDRFGVERQSSHHYSMIFLALGGCGLGLEKNVRDRPSQTPTQRQTYVCFRRLREEKVGGEGKEGGKRARISLNPPKRFSNDFALAMSWRISHRRLAHGARAPSTIKKVRCPTSRRRHERPDPDLPPHTPVPIAPRARPRPRTGSASSVPREVPRHAVRGARWARKKPSASCTKFVREQRPRCGWWFAVTELRAAPTFLIPPLRPLLPVRE